MINMKAVAYVPTVRDAVQSVLNTSSEAKLLKQVQQHYHKYGPDYTLLLMAFTDYSTKYFTEPFFWNQPLEIFEERFIEDFYEFSERRELPVPLDLVDQICDLFYFNVAYNAIQQPGLRKALGLRLPFRFKWSHAGLLYIVLSTYFHYNRFPTKGAEMYGYIVFQWGYVLLAAGIFSGTFHVLGLKSRLGVWSAATACFFAGAFLLNR